MNAAEVWIAFQKIQIALFQILGLDLTGWMFPPPAQLTDGDTFDYIIIGAGTCGSVVTTRLVQKKYNVLVIEAGQDAPFETTLPALVTLPYQSHVDWNYTTTQDGYSHQCLVDRTSNLNIGKMLGGSGELQFMSYSRGHPENFNEWAQLTGDPDWKWHNVLKYFKRSENVSDGAIRSSKSSDSYGSKGYIGVTRDQEPMTGEILKGFEQIGKYIIDDIDGNRIGYGRGLVTVKGGFRQGAGSKYLRHISESRYIATAKGTLATRIVFDENKKAESVEIITEDGNKIIVKARREIIVSAGAIKSPQLLMLSGIGPKIHLEGLGIQTISDLPVGKNLQDHVAAFLPFKINKPAVSKARDPGKYPAPVFSGYASLNESNNRDCLPEYNIFGLHVQNMKLLLEICLSYLKFSEGMCNKLYDDVENKQLLITALTNLHSCSRGQVLLNSADPMDPPKVLSGGFSSDRDLENMIDYITHYLTVEESDAFKNLGATRIDLTTPRCDAFTKGSREYWRCYILCMMINYKNFSGTCAMGTVVDSRLRVLGVSGLRVADASVMPRIVSGYAYNTVVMIGERAADIIIEDAGEEYNSMEHEKIRKDQIKNMPN